MGLLVGGSDVGVMGGLDVGVGVGVGDGVGLAEGAEDAGCELGVEAAEVVGDDVVGELDGAELDGEELLGASDVAGAEEGKSKMPLGATWLTSGPSRRS